MVTFGFRVRAVGIDDRSEVDRQLLVSCFAGCFRHRIDLFGHQDRWNANREVTNRASRVKIRTSAMRVSPAPQANGAPPGWVTLEKICVGSAVLTPLNLAFRKRVEPIGSSRGADRKS